MTLDLISLLKIVFIEVDDVKMYLYYVKVTKIRKGEENSTVNQNSICIGSLSKSVKSMKFCNLVQIFAESEFWVR